MGGRSRWFGSIGVMAVLGVVLIVLSLTAFAGRTQGEVAGAHQSPDPSIKLAQSYYYPNYPQARPRRKYRRRRAVEKCKFPWTYSAGLRRCICVQEGYGQSEGRCVKVTQMCPKNASWSDDAGKCVCGEGFTENGGQCAGPKAGIATYAPAEGPRCLWPRVKSDDGKSCSCTHGYTEQAGRCISGDSSDQALRRAARPDELLTNEVLLVQRCLKEAGYLRTNAQGRMGNRAWTAYWFFKQDYSVGRTPKGIHDAAAQHKLFTLCPRTSSKLALRPAVPSPGQPADAAPQHSIVSLPAPAEIKPVREVKAPVKRVYARPEAGCLPDDLYKMITGTYGPRPKLKKCTRLCLPKPANITKQEIEDYETNRGIRWCRACIELSAQLPLDDILRLERGANVQICTRPPSTLPRWTGPAASGRKAYTRVRALYTLFPPATDHGKDIAVVIGNGTYRDAVPVNASAHSSAGALYAILTEHLGYRQENIIDVRDAPLKELTRIFGSSEDPKGDLWRRVQKQPGARVLIYYAGHAGTRADQSDSYLMPVDAIKYREERTSYPMSRLYANLEKLEAASVLLLLEAGFGRDLSDFVFPPNLPGIQASALPGKPLARLTVISASDRDQKTLDDPKYGIGLFTRYLIEGLAGRADLKPIGNGDRKIDTIELFAYTSHMVRLAARKSFGLLQNPMISNKGNVRITRVQVQAQ